MAKKKNILNTPGKDPTDPNNKDVLNTLGAEGDESTVPLKNPENDPNNVEAKKYFVFNETGNIMIASTIEPDQPIEETVRRVFAEVSVFFAGMTKAISTTTNPDTGNPYTIYNYRALKRIINGSGLFINVTQEDLLYKTDKIGVEFSKELFEGLLGLATGTGGMKFASAMISAIGKEGAEISKESSRTESKVGSIVFVCEYLLGIPLVSAIVAYVNCKKYDRVFKAGPCITANKTSTTLKLYKDTYFFVTPTFIREYAGDLASIREEATYIKFVNWLYLLLEQTPYVIGVFNSDDSDDSDDPIKNELIKNTGYQIRGEFFPARSNLENGLKIEYTTESGDSIEVSLMPSDWSPNVIKFTTPDYDIPVPVAIQILDEENITVASTAAFKIIATS